MSEPDTENTVSQPMAANLAQQNVQKLRSEADHMLLQLMLQQQNQLNEMVQQLQNGLRADPVEIKASSSSEEVQSQSAEAEPDSSAMAEEVVEKQQTNLVHLDAIIDRINETMDGSLNILGAQMNSETDEGNGNDKTNADIRNSEG